MLAAAPLALLWVPALAWYPDDPPPGHTGGFGEPSCARCHFDQPVDDGVGTLSIEGLPAAYDPGKRYLLRVVLTRPGLRRGGFEIAARFAEGDRSGGQAGELRVAGERVRLTRSEAGIDYAHHTRGGTEPTAPDTARWTLEWTAPTGGGAVALHLAGNAADGDQSALGDHILLRADTVRPRGGG